MKYNPQEFNFEDLVKQLEIHFPGDEGAIAFVFWRYLRNRQLKDSRADIMGLFSLSPTFSHIEQREAFEKLKECVGKHNWQYIGDEPQKFLVLIKTARDFIINHLVPAFYDNFAADTLIDVLVALQFFTTYVIINFYKYYSIIHYKFIINVNIKINLYIKM